ncbi:MAG TPA: HTH domain-containing protein [Thermoanaerobaculia bacterium]
MGVFLDAAYRVLLARGRAMSSREIADEAVRRGYLDSKGKTPWQTMKSKLSTDILRQGERSAFMRTGQGQFALRAWTSNAEYVADRYKKSLFDEEIMVFPRLRLSEYAPAPGLHFSDLAGLIRQCQPMRRSDAEADMSVVQLVSAFVVRNGSKVLTHKRTKRLPESRLHGFYSLTFGGHLNPSDITPLFSPSKPEQWAPWLLRELGEEVKFRGNPVESLVFRGLLYDNAREVSTQHVGVTYEITVHSQEFAIGERGFLMDAKFESLSEIRARAAEFENWSLLLLESMEHQWAI